MSFEGNILNACGEGHVSHSDVYDEPQVCEECNGEFVFSVTIDQTNGHPQYEEDFNLEEYLEPIVSRAAQRIEEAEKKSRKVSMEIEFDVKLYDECLDYIRNNPEQFLDPFINEALKSMLEQHRAEGLFDDED